MSEKLDDQKVRPEGDGRNEDWWEKLNREHYEAEAKYRPLCILLLVLFFSFLLVLLLTSGGEGGSGWKFTGWLFHY